MQQINHPIQEKPQFLILISDHAGFEQKSSVLEFIQSNYPHLNLIDLSPEVIENDDYPDITFAAVTKFQEIDKDKYEPMIIAFCGTGNGMTIALNRNKELRAINGYSSKQVILGRQHNNANCLCLAGPLLIEKKANELLKLFLTTKFSLSQRHVRRIEKLS